MQTETAIGAAMKRAGVPTGEARLYTTAIELLANGRNIEAATAAFVLRLKSDGELLQALARDYLNDAAMDMRGDRKGSEGQSAAASNGHISRASASRDHDDGKGHDPFVDKAIAEMPRPSSPQRNGAGQTAGVGKTNEPVPRPVSPSRAKRGIEAIVSIQNTLARSLFDTIVLPDGRKLADVPWHEQPKIAAEHRRISRIAIMVHNWAVPADPAATARQMMKEQDFATILERAEMFNDIA